MLTLIFSNLTQIPPTAEPWGSRDELFFFESLLTLWFFRLLTSCSLAIKSISHCQWGWSSLNLNEEALVLLLLWDLYIH